MAHNRLFIDMAEVARLRDYFYTWRFIAGRLNISVKTLIRRCAETGYTDNKPWATYEEIVEMLIQYRNRNPNPSLGERSMHAYIRSQGSRASRGNLRAAIRYLDPEGAFVRSRRRLRRREYSGPGMKGFNHVNHIDGKHICTFIYLFIYLFIYQYIIIYNVLPS